ncbi:MAG: hypothetical protein OXE58_12785 [Acidobacteria bacterium]|nr:hypothetical protein [Acidobacteriota bacterium]
MQPALSFRRDVLMLMGGVPAAYALGLWLGSMGLGAARWVLPLLLAAPAIHGLWRYLGEGRRLEAVRLMLGWALALVLFGPLAMAVAPEAAEAAVFQGGSYNDEMMAWLATGEGAEGDIRLFLPIHLQRLVLFVPLALVSGGALGLLMGAVMLNFMDFFVASYAAVSSGVPAALAWFPWALCRVAAFVILGVVCAEPLVRRLGKVTAPLQPGRRRLLYVAGGLLVADVVLKAALAPMWGRFLAGFLN